MTEPDKPTVLVVDDQRDNIDLLVNILEGDYRVKVALNGERALKIAQKEPDIAIAFLDVMMPEMDGYEVCRQLKENTETQNIDVIFVSAMSEESQIVAGYEAGGIDYVIKPIRHDEILQKTRLAIENRRIRQEMESEKASAFDLAMQAMTSSGELGVVVNFLRSSFETHDYEALGQALVESISGYGLEAVVQLRTRTEVITVGNEGPVSQLEKEFLMVLKDAGRLREKDAYFIANYGNLTLMVKNMPEDEEKRGRMRDNLALLAEGGNSRLAAISLELELEHAINSAKHTLQDLQQRGRKQKLQAQTIMNDLMSELEESFLTYGLTDEQEQMLVQMVQQSTDHSIRNIEQGMAIDEEMHHIVEDLELALTTK